MFSWIFMLTSIVVIIQPLPLWYVSVCNQKNPTLTIDVKPHAFQVLLLFSFPAFKASLSFFSIKNCKNCIYFHCKEM